MAPKETEHKGKPCKEIHQAIGRNQVSEEARTFFPRASEAHEKADDVLAEEEKSGQDVADFEEIEEE